MITNIIITLYESNLKVEKQFIFFLQILLGANKNKLPKRNQQDSRKEKCVSKCTLTWAAPRKSRGERDGRVSGWLQVWRLSSKTFKICRSNSNLHCSELKIYEKCEKKVLIADLSKDTQGFRSVRLSLSNVVHSDNDEESLYACCCTQKMTVKGCHRYSILTVTVHRYLYKVQWR